MRSKSDPITMLKERMLGNNMASVEELKVGARNIYKLSTVHVTVFVSKDTLSLAKMMGDPSSADLLNDECG